MEKMNYSEAVKIIADAKIKYYQTGRSNLTDKEYDDLVEYATKLGYVETVGAAPVDSISKIEHEHPMLSLDKCHTIEEVKKFADTHKVIGMEKADGLTCSATYIDGVLTRLETRGDGVTGNDIMFHAKSFENLPITIDKRGKYVIDGECIILWSDFYKINENMVESERYSHPRNLAAGSLNQLDPTISKKRHLRFYAWDVIEGGSHDHLHSNLLEAIKLGFDVVNFYMSSDYSFTHMINLIKKEADKHSFPIDGVVFKYDDIAYGKQLGRTGHHFKNGIAYKYEDECYATKLRSITWQCGKFGQLTPVANFDPVDVSGVIVEKASVHNISIMKQLGLTHDCTVYIKRANDVIPQIAYADTDGSGDFTIPDRCPVCGGATMIIKDNNSEVLYCANDNCGGKLLGKYKTFVSKKAMDIDGLSEATLDTFLRRGYLTNMFVSIYELSEYKKELYALSGFGKRSIDKLLGAIEDSKDVDLQHFITAFSIPGVGEGQSKLLVKKFPTFKEFSAACDDQYDFSQIDGIGPILSANIHKWWVNNHMQMLDVAQVVRFKNDDFMNKPTGNLPLAGMVFVITGKVYKYKNRDELKSCIESLGGEVTSSVSKNTDYLINNDVTSTSGKNKKAQDLGVKIISEEDFIDMTKS